MSESKKGETKIQAIALRLLVAVSDIAEEKSLVCEIAKKVQFVEPIRSLSEMEPAKWRLFGGHKIVYQ